MSGRASKWFWGEVPWPLAGLRITEEEFLLAVTNMMPDLKGTAVRLYRLRRKQEVSVSHPGAGSFGDIITQP